MSLGQTKWDQHKAYYESLTLRSDGDRAERYAADNHRLDTKFKNYENFWKCHVAPATQRPADLGSFREDTSEEIMLISQRSYTVLVYLLEAYDYLQLVRSEDLGPRFRNWYCIVTYAGNAMQVFAELQNAIQGPLARRLGTSVCLFPDWEGAWKPLREEVINFRNYVTHQGYFQVFLVPSDGGQIPHVLCRSEVTRQQLTWTHSITDFEDHPERWMPLSQAADEIVAETTAWLDQAYERIVDTLAPWLALANYQRLWGWKDSGTVVVAPSKVTVPSQKAGWTSTQSTPVSGTHIVPSSSGIKVVSDGLTPKTSATTAPPQPDYPLRTG